MNTQTINDTDNTPESGLREATCCASSVTMPKRFYEQVLASAEQRGIPRWVDATKWLPQGPHEVLATDGEGWFIAYLQGSEWWLHELDEPCDSEVTHWMELPEIPEV